MEIANLQHPESNGAHPAANAMEPSMDIDMDLDLGPLPDPEPIEAEPATAIAQPLDGAADPLEEEAQYEKVHIRGVDELSTDNIKQFAINHFSLEPPSRIEWIDDTSANIVYSSSQSGLQALSAFTQVSEEEDASALPAFRLRSAKLLPSHPDSVLQVRSAVKTDRKKPRAHEASRFYLMHPEHDPRERLRRELADGRRSGGDSSDGDYTRRRFDDRELRRRRERGGEGEISASMYDDEGASYSDANYGRDRRGRGRQGELFPDEEGRSGGRLRNRSASPGRDTLEESARYEDDRQASRRRFRERSPQQSRRNGGKELFPSNAGESDPNVRELFPNRPTSSYIKKELFPSKVSNHRRSDAIDAHDDPADLLSRRISKPVDKHNRNIELFPESSNRSGVNIRGSAGQDQGMSIRGASSGMSIKGRGDVKELFPSTYSSNAGKELFSNRIEGRGGPRRRAEDMFS